MKDYEKYIIENAKAKNSWEPYTDDIKQSFNLIFTNLLNNIYTNNKLEKKLKKLNTDCIAKIRTPSGKSTYELKITSKKIVICYSLDDSSRKNVELVYKYDHYKKTYQYSYSIQQINIPPKDDKFLFFDNDIIEEGTVDDSNFDFTKILEFLLDYATKNKLI